MEFKRDMMIELFEYKWNGDRFERFCKLKFDGWLIWYVMNCKELKKIFVGEFGRMMVLLIERGS